ncbi:Nucleoside-diphosphate-sugar epimerase [Arsukibacterium tuosuense]|uniref:Nucleoside-diphosphate-sugar epimerase n=1 Tax=Arsukibacterium tuosuense TaxID=1323745 RepID=A0A285IV22_9GAMM|nr:SDR family oxidoreductase [Arsukibacterium tuosuense]SNY51849.1 Nucleoside-diphosphate-sugar epimerase [Arsukibacterium tuosuense]
MNNILITGASGFIGSKLVEQLLAAGSSNLTVVSRNNENNFAPGVTLFQIESIENTPDWSLALKGIDVVIHCAARVHSVSDNHKESLERFRAVNVEATLALARQAIASNVKRFIFISSIGVNGISNTKPFTVTDKPNPTEDYAISKFEAETGLKALLSNANTELVIIRPPLVYGLNAKGNFGHLFKLAQKRLPMPLGAINNKRSLVSLDNLVDLIQTCISHPNAKSQTFMVSDDHDVSTTELVRLVANASGKGALLLPVPVSFLKFFAACLGKKSMATKLCDSLQVDIAHTKQVLGWSPPLTLEQGIARCFENESHRTD